MTHGNGKIVMQIHRLICMAFHPIDNPDDFIVNHINHIKNDNRADNLEWVTYSENSQAYHRMFPEQVKNKPITPYVKAVVGRDSYGKEFVFASIKEASIATGCDRKSISDVCKGKRAKTKGFVWQWKCNKEKCNEILENCSSQHQ